MQIVFIGAGRLATSLAPALHEAGHEIVQVYSRTMASASALAERVGAEAVAQVEQVTQEADVYVFAVSDTALPTLAEQLSCGREKAVLLHTAGSMPMSVFPDSAAHRGVLYPMQTFSKQRQVDFSKVTIFIEGSDPLAVDTARALASSVSNKVMMLDSEGRRSLHLAAVFACNFANHCYELSAEILAAHGLPFEVMLPLVDETAAKVHELSPLQAQTGPAVRNDKAVMQRQLDLLNEMNMQRLAHIYNALSDSIHETSITPRQ